MVPVVEGFGKGVWLYEMDVFLELNGVPPPPIFILPALSACRPSVIFPLLPRIRGQTPLTPPLDVPLYRSWRYPSENEQQDLDLQQ